MFPPTPDSKEMAEVEHGLFLFDATEMQTVSTLAFTD